MSIFKGGLPNEPQNGELAHEVVTTETWTALDENSIYEVLESLTVDHTPTVKPEEAVAALFVTIGYLLSTYSRPLGFANFYEFLDALLTELEKV